MTYAQILASHFPENSFGGQCGTFCHRLVQFAPVGNFLNQKIASLARFGIPMSSLDSFKVGDVVLQRYPVYGHLSVINDIVGTKLQLSESNYYLNGRVHHTRQIEHGDPSILGVFRGPLTYPIPLSAPPVLRVKLVQNGDWASLGNKFLDIRTRLLAANGGKFDINIDVDHVALTPPFTSLGYPVSAGVDLGWYQQNIAPYKGNYHIVCFLTPKDPAVGNTFGWHSTNEQIQVFADENETITSSEFGTLNVFVQAFLHEVQHCLVEMQGIPDHVHDYLNNIPPPPNSPGIFQLKELMATYDYEKLISVLG